MAKIAGVTLSDDEAASLFAAFDADGTGAIAREEFVHVLRNVMKLRTITKAEVFALMDDLDTDNDGSIDFEEFTETYGIPLPYANYDDMVDAYVAHINSTGGIHGRMIELVHSHFLPVGPVSAEATCVELAEDHRVFVVLNGFAGPGAESTNLCFPGTYDTILIGGKPTPEQLAESTAPWISYDISLGRRGRAFVNLLLETGRLEDLDRP